MNRIVIIGNGFDLAHGLQTGYKDFIDNYWTNVYENVFSTYSRQIKMTHGVIHDITPYRDSFVNIIVKGGKTIISDEFSDYEQGDSIYCELRRFIDEHNKRADTRTTTHISFENRFWGQISRRCSLMNWVDIENEYYEALKKLLADEDSLKRRERVKKLNDDFKAVKTMLEEYIKDIVNNTDTKRLQSIYNYFYNVIDLKDVARSKRKGFFDSILAEFIRFDSTGEMEEDRERDPQYTLCLSTEERNEYYISKRLDNINFRNQYCIPQTIILNFNYTKTAEKYYAAEDFETINIHGELGNKDNPIIFGYGDELDDDYKKIEKLQDNDFLENIKSINYHNTRNYRKLLDVIESDVYQIFVMGHSCGNSDRTLLNTLFEHNNCISIKVFYRQFEDTFNDKIIIKDDYTNIIRNISRNFNDKAKMRDVVVNRENCLPLVPVQKP